VPLTVTRFSTSPAARAGRPFTATLGVSDDERLERGKIRCTARAAGRNLKASKRVRGLTATCQWVIPRRARGRLVRGSIAVTSGGDTVRRTFSRRIR
jgi:hypothetical protein